MTTLRTYPDPIVRALPEATAEYPFRDELWAVLEAAAAIDVRDAAATARLRRDAHAVTARLVAVGRLPAHLRVEPSDPTAVVIRAVASAWRRTAPMRAAAA